MDLSYVSQQLINGIVLGSIYGLIAIGYTMVYGIIGMINFAHGDIYMIATYLTAIGFALCAIFALHPLAITLFITFFFTITITGLYGWAIERLAYRRLRQATRLAPLISAIGVSLVLQNFVRLSQGAKTQAIPSLIQGQQTFQLLGIPIVISNVALMIMLFTFLCMGVLMVLITKTRLGRAMRAMQQDLTMATLLGISPNKVIPLVFVLGSALAAIAGTLVTLDYGSFDFSIGFITGIKAFTSAVVGGIGSIFGAMLGGMLLGLAESLFSAFISVEYKDIFAFGILILILIFKPSGILGSKDVEKI